MPRRWSTIHLGAPRIPVRQQRPQLNFECLLGRRFPRSCQPVLVIRDADLVRHFRVFHRDRKRAGSAHRIDPFVPAQDLPRPAHPREQLRAAISTLCSAPAESRQDTLQVFTRMAGL